MIKKISDFMDKIKAKRANKKPSYEIFNIRKKAQINTLDTLLMEESQMKDAISTFLESNEHSNKYDSFIEHLRQDNPKLLASVPREEIRELYNQRYEIYLEHHDKNEFGLDLEYVNAQLRKLFYSFWSSSVSDGSFLYAWKTSKTNGIEKYQKVAEGDLYKEIEPIEKELCEYIFSP